MTNTSHDAGEMLWEAMTREMATWPRGFDPEIDTEPERPQDWAHYRADWVANAAVDALTNALAQVEAVKEACAIAARDALVAYEWPPQDGDAQVDAVLAAIRALDVAGVDVPVNMQGPGWLPIESAPKNLQTFLVGWIGKDLIDMAYMNGSGDVFGEYDAAPWLEGDGPTHWRPLPQPPGRGGE